MNLFLRFILLYLLANPTYAQPIDRLLNAWWTAVQVTEVIKGDTTIYKFGKCGQPYDNKQSFTFPDELRISAYFSSNSNYTAGFDSCIYVKYNITCHLATHPPVKRASGSWKLTDDHNILITLDTKSIKEGYNPNFSGNLRLSALTDSTAIFVKEIARNAAWTREYHLVKR